jgi:hypothetical protein
MHVPKDFDFIMFLTLEPETSHDPEDKRPMDTRTKIDFFINCRPKKYVSVCSGSASEQAFRKLRLFTIKYLGKLFTRKYLTM